MYGQLVAQLISNRRLATTRLPDSFGRQRSSSYWSHQWELNLQVGLLRAFSQAAPTVWNGLPLASLSAETYKRFRSAMKKHFYELTLTNWSLWLCPLPRFVF